jgi:hypothetical protein
VDKWTSLFWVTVSLVILEEARLLPFGTLSRPKAGFYPFILGVILGLLSLALVAKSWLGAKGGGGAVSFPDRTGCRNVLFTLAAMFLFYLFFESVGFLLTTFGLIFLLVKFVDPQRWLYSFCVAVVVAIVSYLLFEVLLKANLPKGLLEPWLF